MKPNKTDEISMREAVSLHWWAAKVWWKIEPKLFITTILHSLVKSMTPYVTIWLSAQLINELAGNRDPDALWRWVILTVSITAGLNLLTAALHHWREAVHGTEWELENRMEAVKMMDMDFAAVESPKTDELLWSISTPTSMAPSRSSSSSSRTSSWSTNPSGNRASFCS